MTDLTKPFLELADRVETFCGENIETTKAIRTLVAMLEKAVEQRDGYRDNYHSLVLLPVSEIRQIMADNDAELAAIAESKS